MANESADNLSLFMPAPGGFVYRARHPWFFGPGRRYFVTAAQREAILELSEEPSTQRMRGWLYTMMMLVLVVDMPIISYLHGYRLAAITPVDYGIIALTTVVAMLVALRIIYYPLNERLKPLIATLPRTDQKVSIADVHRSLFKNTTSAQYRKRAWIELGFSALCWFDIALSYRFESRSMATWKLSIELGIAILSMAAAALEFWLAHKKSLQEAKQGMANGRRT